MIGLGRGLKSNWSSGGDVERTELIGNIGYNSLKTERTLHSIQRQIHKNGQARLKCGTSSLLHVKAMTQLKILNSDLG